MAEYLGERFECITTVLNNEYLSRCGGETSGKCNVMKGLIWLTVGGPSPSWWGRQLVTSYPVRKQREMDAVAQLLFPFHSAQDPSLWTGVTHSKAYTLNCLPSSVNVSRNSTTGTRSCLSVCL